MSIAYWCVLVAGLFPYIFTVLAKAKGIDFDNHSPREYLNNLTGWRKRANWIQINSFEAFPFFAAAVIIANLNHAPSNKIDILAMSFILFRILYAIAYLKNIASLRTIVWTGGFICVVSLFYI